MSRSSIIKGISTLSDRDVSPSLSKDYLDDIKRTERISAALHLLSELFPQSEPIGQRMKSIGVDLVTHMTALSLSPGNREGFLKLYVNCLLEILSLLEVAHLSNRISTMNYRVISAEISRSVSESEYLVHRSTDTISLESRTKAGSYRTETESLKSNLLKAVAHKGHHIGHIPKKNRKRVSDRRTIDNVSGPKMMGKEERKNAILSALEGGKHLGVKDFLGLIPAVSEKTVQRELTDLVSSGVLEKEGERRWSRYFLSKGGQKPGGALS
jgi:hypothetical protein